MFCVDAIMPQTFLYVKIQGRKSVLNYQVNIICIKSRFCNKGILSIRMSLNTEHRFHHNFTKTVSQLQTVHIDKTYVAGCATYLFKTSFFCFTQSRLVIISQHIFVVTRG
jgi:hypothetical protein